MDAQEFKELLDKELAKEEHTLEDYQNYVTLLMKVAAIEGRNSICFYRVTNKNLDCQIIDKLESLGWELVESKLSYITMRANPTQIKP